MAKFRLIPMLAVGLVASLSSLMHAQNPPMNCAPDGIIEVCTPVDGSGAQSVIEKVAPPAPRITYRDGQLEITADNVPLSDVLREVSRKTGAEIKVPEGSANEPVFANIGPGPVRSVLTALLKGSQFNYVIAGSPISALKSVVLTPAQRSAEVAEGEIASDPSASPQGFKPPPVRAHDQAADRQPGELDPVEIEKARQEAMQSMMRESEDQKKQGAPTPEPPGSN